MVNLPAPEKTDSTLAAAAFLQPTSARKDGVVDREGGLHRGPEGVQVEAHRAEVVLVLRALGEELLAPDVLELLDLGGHEHVEQRLGLALLLDVGAASAWWRRR